MGDALVSAVRGRRVSERARILHPGSGLRPDGDALEGRQDSPSHRRDGDRGGEGPRRQEHARTFPVITGLDHVVLLVNDIGAGATAYQTLFGCAPAWRSAGDGADRVLFTLDNMTVELMSPKGFSVTADRVRAVIAEQGEGLASVSFRTGDLAKMHRRLDRLALKAGPITEAESRDAASGATLAWNPTRAATEVTLGVH